MVAQVNNGSFREVMPDYLPNVTGIDWQPDGTLWFTADDGCYSTLGQFMLSKPGTRNYRSRAAATMILEGFSYSPSSGMAAFIGSTKEHPSEVFVRDR
jgi:dipeptidyl aminopeptidase/acylaminoacyl peptidase